MDFSWGWVKPGSVVTTEPLATGRLELARQAMRRPLAGSQPGLERREQRLHQHLRLAAFPA
jgi:hypothetical protein